MENRDKTKEKLLAEIRTLQERVAELEKSDAAILQPKGTFRESEDRYQALFDRSLDCLYVIDFEGNFIDANPAALSLLGYERPDIPSLNISSLLHEVSLSKALEDLKEVIETGFQKNINEYKLRRKDGSYVDVETKASVILRDGSPHSILGIARDITDRKRVEEALGESERKYRTILESIEEGYYEVDLTGNLTFFNEAMARINGYTREEMKGMNNRAYTDLENSRILFQAFNRVYRTQASSKGIQYDVITKNGAKRTLETSVSLIFDSSGKPVGFRGIARDITELRQAQKALRESEDQYRDLVESSQDLMCTHDLQGQILWVNEEPARNLGYSRNDILKMNLCDLMVPERKVEFDEFLATIRSQGTAKGLMMLQTANGEKRIWEYHNTLRTEGVEEPIVRSISRDVTERIQAERETRETLKKLRKAMGGIIQAIALTVETRDPYTAGHQQRVSDLARAIGQEMGLPEDKVDGLRMAGIVHDLGKIGIPVEILSKPTKLNDLEIELLKIHPQLSYDILKDIDFPWPVAQIVFQHHERINGSGYPLGLSGEAIYLEARILAVADVVEAIASHRPYREAQGIDKALEEISSNRGVLYDPEVVAACLRLFNEKRYQLK
jgi:PAS domain S-box-containing protein